MTDPHPQTPPRISRAPAQSTPPWLWLHGILVYAFLYLPIAVLIIYSFTASNFSTVWSGFSTKWYEELWTDRKRLSALGTSMQLAFWAVTGGAILGTMAAVGQARLHRKMQKRLEGAFLMPIMLPDIVIALSLMMYFSKVWSAQRSLTLMAIAHTLLATSYVYMVVGTRLKGFDWRLMEAARDLGASKWQAFRHVQLPLLWPGVAGGILLAFAVSLDEYVISSFLAGPGDATLPMNIQGSIRKDFKPSINALATLMLLFSVFLALAAALLQRRGQSGSS